MITSSPMCKYCFFENLFFPFVLNANRPEEVTHKKGFFRPKAPTWISKIHSGVPETFGTLILPSIYHLIRKHLLFYLLFFLRDDFLGRCFCIEGNFRFEGSLFTGVSINDRFFFITS